MVRRQDERKAFKPPRMISWVLDRFTAFYVPASILSVDVDLAFENDVFPPGGDRLAHFHQEDPGGLVLASEFAGKLKGALALHTVHGQP
ncbi:hypothetical protein [Rhizobium sp. YTU87027]|uniref:hypothetical protein n=1 Tax=Rhizobium sp. YTU87027 TaxID=3417741 RepID=UPI003D69BBD5